MKAEEAVQSLLVALKKFEENLSRYVCGGWMCSNDDWHYARQEDRELCAEYCELGKVRKKFDEELVRIFGGGWRMNKVILIGRLTANPNLRYTQNGTPVTTFTLAVDRPFTNQGGEKGTDFIDIVTWRKLAEIVANNLEKGRLVAIEGRLQIRSYDDQNGVRRKAAEIVADQVKFLDYRRQNESQSESTEPEFDDIPF